MTKQNISPEKKQMRNILYGILAFTIFISCIIDFYALIDQKHRYLINISMIGIYGIINYVAFKNNLINWKSTIITIIIITIIVTITFLNR